MNAVMNGSIANCSGLINPTAQKIGQTMVCCLIFVVSLLGNSSIALIVYKTQALRKPINFFIVNMAMSDLLYLIFWFPLQLTELYIGFWSPRPLGHAFCELGNILVPLSVVVSIQSLVLIAVDRFGAVVVPLRSPLISSQQCHFFILGTWIVALAVFVPDLYFSYKLVEYKAREEMCFNQWKDSRSEGYYYLSVTVVFVYIPIALLAILYSIIIIKLNFQTIPGEQSVNANEQRAKRNRNVIKMAIAIVLGFVLCMVPYASITLLWYFAWNRFSYCEHVLFWHITRVIISANCAINPCICFIFSGNYRQGLKRLLKCFE